MRNYDAAKRLGFTLTEVLVVLAILGFIASVILGVIKINSTKQFMAGRSLFRSDLATALSVMNIDLPLAKFNSTDNSKEFIQKFADYFDIVRLADETTKNEIFAMDKMKDMAGDPVHIKKYDQYFVTKNGVSVALSYVKSTVTLPKFVPDQSKISVSGQDYEMSNQALNFVTGVYDLNGTKGPNILGRDIGIIMPGYSINEKAGEYFATTEAGTFFLANKNLKTPHGTNPPADDDDDPGITPPGPNPPGPGGYADDDSGDDDDDDNPNGCPEGQIEIAPGVCSTPSDTCPDGSPRVNGECKTTSCTLTEGACNSQGKHFSKEACQCVPYGDCPKGTVKNPETGKCEPIVDRCVKDAKGHTIKGKKTPDGFYKCDIGAAFACMQSGGVWDPDCCYCDCAAYDKQINDKDACKLLGAVEKDGVCRTDINDACHYGNLPNGKNTYYAVGKDSPANHCFKCAKTSSNGYISIGKKTTAKCGCTATCTNKDSYPSTNTNTTKFSNITGDSKDACKWYCNPGKGADQKNKQWTDVANNSNSCSWKCTLTNEASSGVNGNYKAVNSGTQCGYKCVKPNKAAPTGGDAQGNWKWISGSALTSTPTADDCKYECEFPSGVTEEKYDLHYDTCTATLSCTLDDNKCKSIVEKCVSIPSTTLGSCEQGKHAYYAFYKHYKKTTTTNAYRCASAHSSDGTNYRPWAEGFGGFDTQPKNKNTGYGTTIGNYHCDTKGGTNSYLTSNATSYKTCDTKTAVKIEATADLKKCRCNVKISTTTDNLFANKTYTFEYEGWNHQINDNGGIIKDDWQGYRCTYTRHYDNPTVKNTSYDGKSCSSLISSLTNEGFISGITESCKSFTDPVVLIMNEGLKPINLTGEFSLDKVLKLGDSDSIYWMNTQTNPNYLYLIKTKNLDENGNVLSSIDTSALNSWDDIKTLMFTDLGGPSNGLAELKDYTNAKTDYINETSDNWDKLALLLVNRGDGGKAVTKQYPLSEFGITEIWLKSRRNIDTVRESDAAGAVGTVDGCFRRGVKIDKVPDNGYQRTIIDNKVKYCTNVNDSQTCVDEQSNGDEKYTFDTNGDCRLNTLYGGKEGVPYYVENGTIYQEKAFPLVDILFKSAASEATSEE